MATFITSKTSGQWLMGVHVRTTSGWWTYTHNGVTSFARQAGQYNYHDIQVQSNDGEFTIISCNSDGSPNGSITHIFLQDGNLTSFDVTGLSALTELNISINQLTSFNGTGLSSLTSLILNNNNLNIISNLPTTLTYLSLGQNQLTQFDATGLSNLSTLALGNNQLTEFDGTELSNLSELYLSNNQINVSNLVLPIGLNYLEISNNNLTSLDNDSILSLLAENATNLNITGGQFFTTGERTSIGTPYYNTLVNNLSWNIEGAYLSTPLIFKTYDNSSSEFSPQNVVVNFDPSTKTWSVWGSLQSDGGMLGGLNWEEIGNIGTLSSIDNGDGTWQVIYEFEYNYPSSYSWFEVRSSGGEDTLQVTTEIIDFSASVTGVNYNGDVNQLNFVLQDQWYGETLLSGTLSSTETAVGVYDLVYTFSAPSIVNISNPFIAIFENYGGENQTSIMSSIVVTAEQTTTTTTTTEEPTTTTTTTSSSIVKNYKATFTRQSPSNMNVNDGVFSVVTQTGVDEFGDPIFSDPITVTDGQISNISVISGNFGNTYTWDYTFTAAENSGYIVTGQKTGFNGWFVYSPASEVIIETTTTTTTESFNYNSNFFSNVSFTGISKGNYNYQINHTLTQLQLKSLYPLASQFRIGVYKLSDGSKTNFTSVSDVNTYQNMTILSSYTDDFSFVLVANFPNGTEVDCEVYPSTFNIADATTTTTTTTEEPTTTTTTTEEQTTTTTTTEYVPSFNFTSSNYIDSLTTYIGVNKGEPVLKLDVLFNTSNLSQYRIDNNYENYSIVFFCDGLQNGPFNTPETGVISSDGTIVESSFSRIISSWPLPIELTSYQFKLAVWQTLPLDSNNSNWSDGIVSVIETFTLNIEGNTTTTTTTEDQTTTTTTTTSLIPTFVTSKAVNEFINIEVKTSTAYWKYYHNGGYSSVYSDLDGIQSIEVLSSPGEFTIIPCDVEGNESGYLTGLYLVDNQITSFDGTGLSGLTDLNFDDNPLTSFNGGDMGLITSLEFTRGITTLTSFTAGNMTNLTTLDLSNNQITSFSGTGLSNLESLYLVGNQLTSFNGTGLSGLTYLDLGGNQLTSFNGTGLFSLTNLGLHYNQLTEFITTDLGNLLVLGLSRNQLTSFNGTGLTNLTTLSLADNPLTSFDGTDLGNLSQLNFMSDILINRISSLDNFIFPTNLNSLNLNYNQISSFDGSVFTNLQSLQLEGNGITSLDNFVLPTTLTNLSFSGNPKAGLFNYLTEFDGTGLPALTHLFLRDNLLTSFIGTGLSSLTDLELRGNQITSFDGNGLTSLIFLDLLSNPTTPEVNDSILNTLELNGLSNGQFYTTGGRTSAGTADYDYLISRGWNISGADLPEETTTTTTTVAPPISYHSLTFRKISYGDNSPKNAPLTISEFEGNFAYLSDYVNHLLGVIDGLNVTVTNLQSENQSLSNRVTNIENGGANN